MKETLSIRIDSDLLKFLKEEANIDFRNLNNYVEMVLAKHKQEKQALKTSN